MKIQHDRTSVHALEYHIVFCTKYRRKAITETVRNDLYDVLRDIAKKNKTYSIEEINGEEDHVHLLVSTNPRQNIPIMIKQLKGASARTILTKHPEIKNMLWGGHFWSPTYFIATVSDNTDNQIKDYIASQGTR